ncbi:MAG TPA: HAMP domain-containing protein, partial [Nocardioides sp.]
MKDEAPGWHYRRSLASRVALLTTIAVAVTVGMVALGAYITVRVQMQQTLDASLLERAERAADGALVELTAEYQYPSWTFGAADVRIAFLNKDGLTRSMDDGPRIQLGEPELEVARGERKHSIRTIEAEGVKFRVVTVPTRDPGVALLIAQSLDGQERVLGRLGLATFLFGAAGVILAGAFGWGVARNGLRPVRRLSRRVEEIARTEDLRLIQVEGSDEIARLGSAFNVMLAALEASRDRQRQLVGDAAHELRTPFT